VKEIVVDEEKCEVKKIPGMPSGHDTVLIFEHKGKKLYCHRPYYRNTVADKSLIYDALALDKKTIYGEEGGVFFDQDGRIWCDKSLRVEKLLQLFTERPQRYLTIMAEKVDSNKAIIEILRDVEKELKKSEADLRGCLKQLHSCYTDFYRFYSSTYIVYDALVLKFQELLKRFLCEGESNNYLTSFLRSPITREAMRQGAMGEATTGQKRPTGFHGAVKIFYAEPEFYTTREEDTHVISKLARSDLTSEEREAFFSLRSIIPLNIQINEETHYIETKMLWPLTGKLFKMIGEQLNLTEKEIDEMRIEELEKALRQTEQMCLRGLGVSPGVVEGRVRIIRSIADYERFEKGDILVTHITNPSMVILMNKAAGIICDIGNVMSHPSIIAREMGRPCIVSARDEQGNPATRVLREGDRIRMDGGSGKIEVLSHAEKIP